MPVPDEADLLQGYLDGNLPPEGVRRLEQRLKTDPGLADQLLRLAREEATLHEWARARALAGQIATAAPSPRRPVRRLLVLVPLAAAAVALVVGGLLWFRPGPREEPPAAPARLVEVQGNVVLITSDGQVPAHPDKDLLPGQVVTTGGEGSLAVLRYADGTRLELADHTRVELRPGTAGKQVFLQEGIVNATVARQPPGRPLLLATFQAEVRVPGTRLTCACVANSTRVDLEEGTARVTRTSDGKSVEVEPGSYAVAASPFEPFVPHRLPVRIPEPRAVFREGPGPTSCLAYSRDGATLATGDWHGTIRLYDAKAARLLRTIPGRKQRVLSLAFAPDGRTLAAVYNDGAARLLDPATGVERRGLPWDKRNRHRAAAFSPDGQWLVLAGTYSRGQEQLLVFDTTSYRQRQVSGGGRKPALALAFSPDGRLLAAGGEDNVIRVWEAGTWKRLHKLRGQAPRVESLAFAPDGRTLASAGRGGLIQLWDVATGKVRQTFNGYSREVRSVAFSPDGKILASGSDSTARLWDVAGGQEWIAFRADGYAVCAVAFAPDGRTLATAGWKRMTKLWPVPRP